jgi:hypothetical protein
MYHTQALLPENNMVAMKTCSLSFSYLNLLGTSESEVKVTLVGS